MADFCSLKQTHEYKHLQEMSGMSTDIFDNEVEAFVDINGRMPHLDEINANSSEFLKNNIGFNNGYASKDKILQYTGTENIRNANIEINIRHEDLIVKMDELASSVKTTIERRPSKTGVKETQHSNLNNIEATQTLKNICRQISTLYGVDVELVNTQEILRMGVQEGVIAKGFIKDGKIYVNTDIADIHTPMHELLHLIMGTVKAHNRELYNRLCDMVGKRPGFAMRNAQYTNRSMRDLQEEELVEQTARMLFGVKSSFNDFSTEDLSEFAYQFSRAIDTILDGKSSSSCIDIVGALRDGKTLFEIGNTLCSKLLDNTSVFRIDYGSSRESRMISNMKTELFNNNLLTEEC